MPTLLLECEIAYKSTTQQIGYQQEVSRKPNIRLLKVKGTGIGLGNKTVNLIAILSISWIRAWMLSFFMAVISVYILPPIYPSMCSLGSPVNIWGRDETIAVEHFRRNNLLLTVLLCLRGCQRKWSETLSPVLSKIMILNGKDFVCSLLV